MATRKKKAKAKSKPRVKKPAARKTKPGAKKKKTAAPKQKAFDAGSTQQIAIAEIVGDIEERMALDRLAETTQ